MMPPKIKKNVVIMVINIGRTSIEQNSAEEEPFIDKAKYTMKLIVEKKIFLQPKDEIGIITMGDHNSDYDYLKNIKIYTEHVLVPNWQMVKYINNLESTCHSCNWIEALHVSLNYIKQEDINKDNRVYLIIFNNYKEDDEDINKYDSGVIINELKNLINLEILFVGEDSLEDISTLKNYISCSLQFVLSIIENTNAKYVQLNTFLKERSFYNVSLDKSLPWKANLEWAGLKIPCNMYVKVAEGPHLGSWKMQAVHDEFNKINNTSQTDDLSKSYSTKNVVKENIMMDIHRNEISSDKIINGYKFGGKYIPFSEEDEIAMKYIGTKKGLIVYGFAPKDEIKLEYWSGLGSRMIVPAEEEYAEAFYSFLEAMVIKKYVAIVRRVYANNNIPKMGVVFPKMDDNEIRCLVYLEIPFVHDLRIIQTRPIKSLEKIVNREELKALDNFIESMTILDNSKAFPNVRSQYHWNVLADRALNPEKPMALPNNYLKDYLKPSEHLLVKAKPHLENLNKFFGFSKCNKNIDKNKTISPLKSKVNQSEENQMDTFNQDTYETCTNDSINNIDDFFFIPNSVDIDMTKIDNV